MIEKPPKDWREATRFWRRTLSDSQFQTWGLLQWLLTKPYDKSEAYTIARRLDVDADQLPCIVFLSGGVNSKSVVFPIKSVSPEFFRGMFSSMEKLITKSRGARFSILTKNFEKIAESANEKLQPANTNATHAQYTFDGYTVFINQPQGALTLSNFQKGLKAIPFNES